MALFFGTFLGVLAARAVELAAGYYLAHRARARMAVALGRVFDSYRAQQADDAGPMN